MSINYDQYEETERDEAKVCAVATLEKTTTLLFVTGSNDPRDLWANQELNMAEILSQCEKVLAQLQSDLKVHKYNDVDLDMLREAIANWKQVSFDVF